MKVQKIHSIYFMAAMVMILSACSTGEPARDYTESREKLVNNTAQNIISPAYDDLLSTYTSGLDEFLDDPSISTLNEAQNWLMAVRLAWQSASIYSFGPAEQLNLNTVLNTHPLDTEKVESNIESGNYTLGSLGNLAAEGFPAMEYLLHHPSGDADKALEWLTDANSENRVKYLTDLYGYCADLVQSAASAWAPNAPGNFYDAFTSDGSYGTDVGSGLSLIVNALDIHLQRQVRDAKIGIPAGVRTAGVTRPGSVEALYGRYSSVLAQKALLATHKLYLGETSSGASGYGLSDYLVELDNPDLAIEIDLLFEEAIQSAAGLQDPLSQFIDTHNEQTVSVFVDIQNIVPLIKSDMASIMSVIITNQDADGD